METLRPGGPTVAGIGEIWKAMFEQPGSVANVPQQMEHPGVPMVVDMTRQADKLIYRGALPIKWRQSGREKDMSSMVKFPATWTNVRGLLIEETMFSLKGFGFAISNAPQQSRLGPSCITLGSA
jgi:hypothetical protein